MANIDTALLITQWFNYTISIPLIFLGNIGAILNIVIFTKKKSFWSNPSINYLLAGAVLTAIHLSGIYIQSILVNGFGLSLYNGGTVPCAEHNYLMYTTTVSAISFPCWAAFDQYAATSRNASFRNRWSSIRVVRIAICCTVAFWAITYIPVIFTSEVVNGGCEVVRGPYGIFINYILTPLVFAVGPLLVISIFTVGTVRNLCGSVAQGSHDQLAQQIRRMLFPQLVILAVSGVPFGFQGIYLDLTRHVEKDTVRLSIEYVVGQVILLLYHCNYLCTFYIYWYMSSEVRKSVKQIFIRVCCHRSVVKPLDNTTDQPISLRPLNSGSQSFKVSKETMVT